MPKSQTQTSQPHEPEYLAPKQAAELVGVHPLTIRRAIASGDLPAMRMGPRIIRVKRSDVLAMLRPIPTARGGAA